PRLRDKEGKPYPFVNFYLNDEDVRFRGGFAAPVQDGDEVTVIPAIAGGGVRRPRRRYGPRAPSRWRSSRAPRRTGSGPGSGSPAAWARPPRPRPRARGGCPSNRTSA